MRQNAERAAVDVTPLETSIQSLPAEGRDLDRVASAILESEGVEPAIARRLGPSVARLLSSMSPRLAELARTSFDPHVAEEMAEWVERLADLLSDVESAVAAQGRVECENQSMDETKQVIFEALYEEVRPLETMLRTFDVAFQNMKRLDGADLDIAPRIFVVDADPTNGDTRAMLEQYLQSRIRSFDVASLNIGALVVSDRDLSLLERKELEAVASRFGMLLYSDLPDSRSFVDLMADLERREGDGEGLVRSEIEASSSVVAANYLLARSKNRYEREGIYVAPSMTLAAIQSRSDRLCCQHGNKTALGSPAAGPRAGEMRGIRGLRIDAGQDEVNAIESKKVNIVYDGGQKTFKVSSAMSLSSRAYFCQYHVQRLFDYVKKRVELQAWSVRGQRMLDSVIEGEFEKPMNRVMNALYEDGHISDDFVIRTFIIDETKGVLGATVQMRPTLVAETIQITVQPPPED